MSTFDNAKALNSAAQTSNPFWTHATILKRENANSKMASMLANLIPDGKFEHLEASISDVGSDGALARITAFTSNRIVVVQVAGKAAPTAVTASRRALQSLVLSEVPNLFVGGSGDGGEYRVELDYGQALESFGHIHLGHSSQSGHNLMALREFLPSLLGDLQSNIEPNA